MARRILATVMLAFVFAGCKHIPYFKKWYKPPYLPYLGSKMFSFEYPRKWGEPAKLEHGAEIREPKGLGSFSIEWIPKEAKAYKTPDKYRREMALWGSVEDSHIVRKIEISSRTAFNVVFTGYEYDPRYMLGEKVAVRMTDFTVAADPRGVFVLTLKAPRESFRHPKLRKEHARWRESMTWASLPQD